MVGVCEPVSTLRVRNSWKWLAGELILLWVYMIPLVCQTFKTTQNLIYYHHV